MAQTGSIDLKVLLDGTMFEIPAFLDAAMALAKLVHAEHKRNSVIRNLNPAAIRINPQSNLATLSDTRKPDYAYWSPEQTGRMNRAPDRRSDLYALGVIYYEMLAGQMPLQATSVEAWVHAHLAIVPRPLHELRPELAGPLSDIVMKLLAKAPEDRYQSAYGLLADLKRCALSHRDSGGIPAFEIARMDAASRFLLPRMLFGREAEEVELLKAFELARAGESAFVFVTGRAGIGKTALIRELQNPVAGAGGRFIAGKCDLMNRDIPFAPILQALRGLIRQIWGESPDRVAKWKAKLTDALGQGAGVISALLPEAAKLLGDPPSVQPLPPAEAAIRFRRLFPVFIRVLADREHPLVVFLDDLQWADPATLDVLRMLAHDPALQGLLVLGALRPESASSAESRDDIAAAALWIEQSLSLHKAEEHLRVRHIALDVLPYTDVIRFTSYVLKEDTDRVRLLAKPLFKRTGGNPLYLHRFLDSLYRENKLYFDEEQAVWTWDTDAVKQIPQDPDILDLIATRLRMLPHDTIRLLGIAGAIGHRFHPAAIALVSGHSLHDTFELLRSAEEEGLIGPEDCSNLEETDDRFYTFIHDRVQQAAYKAVPASDQAGLHLRIGREMRHSGLDRKDESIFDIVYHLNLGSREMTDEAERRDLAECNLQAGLKSKASTAFAAALHFLNMGLHLLEHDEEGTDSLAYRLMLELPECEYMCGRTDRAEELLDRLMSRTPNLIERSRIYLIRIEMNAFLKREAVAVHIGQQALAEFGWHIPMNPSKAVIAKELALTQWALYRNRNKLQQLPLNRDPGYKALSDLIMAMSASAYIFNPELTAVLYPRFVRYGLKHGNNEAFTFMLGAYGMVLGFGFPRYDAGYRITEASYQLSHAFESTTLKCRLHFILGLIGQFRSPDVAVQHFEQSIHYGLEAADLTFVGFSMATRILNHTGNLQQLCACISFYEKTSRLLLDEVTMKLFRIARAFVEELQGKPGKLAEAELMMQMDGSNVTQSNQISYYCTCNIITAYLAGNYKEALEWVNRVKRTGSDQEIPLLVHQQHFYRSLSLAALYAAAPSEERRAIRALLGKQLRKKRKWLGGCNSSAYLLITAETKRIDGKREAAAKGYEEAIAAARREGYVLMEALSNELASAFYRASGMVTAANAMLEDACSNYIRWGAVVKVLKLQQAYPQLSAFAPAALAENEAATAGSDQRHEGMEHETSPGSELFRDIVESVMRQAAGRPGAADGKRLEERFLESALRYAGAQKGYVLIGSEEPFLIAAAVYSTMNMEADDTFAASVVRYVVRTGESVVLADASQGHYTDDPYILRHSAKSILCMPIPYPGSRFSSVLYLENNLAPGVFTEERQAVLEMLFSRMAYLEWLDESRSRANDPKDEAARPPVGSAKAEQPLADPLTNREIDILRALADGLSNKEIAESFGLTEGTVKNHVFHLYGKLGVKRRAQAIARGRELQLLQ